MKIKLFILLLAALFTTASFAQGVYFEFKMSSPEHGDLGSLKTFYQDGNTRTEIALSMGGMNRTMVSLIQKADPGKFYQLDADKKTYTATDISQKSELKDYDENDYEITVLGKEKVNGYNATHVKVKNIKANLEQELWTSRDVAGFAEFSKIKTKYTGKENFNKALEAKGASGFPVRIKAAEHGNTIQMDLVKAEKRSCDASLFSLDGYAKNAEASPGSAGNSQEMIQKLQNMTPEERQKFLEQLKEQYNQSQPH